MTRLDHSKGMAAANLEPRCLVDEFGDMPISYH
jgi:hypothetical protein